MAAVSPDGNYFTLSGSLATNNKTTIYTCQDQKEEFTDIVGLSIASSDGNADTCSVIRLQNSDTTEYMLVFKGPVEADFPLQIEGLPIHLTKGDAIKLTATAGLTHPLHWHLSFHKVTRSPGAK